MHNTLALHNALRELDEALVEGAPVRLVQLAEHHPCILQVVHHLVLAVLDLGKCNYQAVLLVKGLHVSQL